MQKVLIFLDVDGVIATRKALDNLWKDYTGQDSFEESKIFMEKTGLPWPKTSMYDWPFDPTCCSAFHLLQRKLYEMDLEPQVVISSSWRLGFRFDLKQGASGTISETFVLKGLQIANIIGRTPSFGQRGQEILKYIEDNQLDLPYVSIDDENPYDVLEYLGEGKCVNTNFREGFQLQHVQETIDKLTAQIIKN